MKKVIALVLAAAALMLTLCACGGNKQENENLKEIYIGVSEGSLPQMEVFYGLETRIPEYGYKLVYKEFATSKEANEALVKGEIDFSCIAEKNEFDAFGSDALQNLGSVYYSPYAIYLISYENKENIKKGASIAVPDDAEGMARALMLLETEGFIGLKDGAGLNATLADIETNDNRYEIFAVASDSVATAEADIVVVDSQQAAKAGFEILVESVAYEKMDSLAAEHYSTVILVNSADIESEEIKTVRKFLFTRRMYDAIDDYTDNVIFPSFEVEK